MFVRTSGLLQGENVFCHVTSLLDGDGSVRDGEPPRGFRKTCMET